MMYPCSEEVKELFKKRYRQVARITVTKNSSTLCVITESDILQNGLTIDRYCNSGKNLEVATAISAELNLRLRNKGKFDNIDFRNAELFVEIGVKKWDARRWENAQIHYIPCGVFIIREPVRPLSIISITAYDRMVLLDKTVNLTGVSYPITVADIISKCCTDCGIELSSDHSLIPDLYINIIPSTLTYREVIRDCAFLIGANAYMDHAGKLTFKWYKTATTSSVIDTLQKIFSSDRYTSDIEKRTIYTYGIRYKEYNIMRVPPSTGERYVINVNEDHPLFDGVVGDDDKWDMIRWLGVRVTGQWFTLFQATIKPMPYLYPMDAVNFITNDGNQHVVLLTHTTFTMNGNMNIASEIEFPYMEITT